MKHLPALWMPWILLFCLLAFPVYAADTEDQPANNEDTEDIQTTPPPKIKMAVIDNTYEKSVVMLEIVQQNWDYKTPWKQSQMGRGVGTGFIIDGKRILTNAHNVSNLKYLEIKKQNVSNRYVAKVLWVAHDCDLAIVDVEDPSFYDDMVALEFGGLPKTNSTVITCGFPVGGKQVSVTEGVVSRIEVGNYSHTQSDEHLLIQTDAAINPGNSGGPVLQNGKVVGVAFQGLRTADNIGYMIPTTVIRHFLKDIEDGTYDGFASSAVTVFEGLHNPAYRAYLKIPTDVQGIVILFVQPNSTAQEIFKVGDVLTQIDGFDIDNDGMIKIHDLTLNWGEALEQKQIDDSIEVAFYRDGSLQKASLKAKVNPLPLPWGLQFDKQPSYYVYAGITFTPLSRNYLQTFGSKWITDIPFTLRYLFYNSLQISTDPNITEYVVISEILPDEVNTYCNGFISQVVVSVNGTKVHCLKDVITELEKDPVSGCHEVRFWGSDSPMILDAAQVAEKQKSILEKYEIPAQAYLEEKL